MKFPKKLPIQEAAGIIAGSLAAGFVSKFVNDRMPTAPAAVKALIPIGAGLFLSTNKNVILKNAGLGMIAKGGADLASAFIPGMAGLYLEAPADQSILSLPADQSILAGDDSLGEIDGPDDSLGEYEGVYGDDMLGDAEMNGIEASELEIIGATEVIE